MARKRDANGRFVKTKLTREELEAKIKRLETTNSIAEDELLCARKEAKTWKQEYDESQEINRSLRKTLDRLTARCNWLYNHLPFWRRSRFDDMCEEGKL